MLTATLSVSGTAAANHGNVVSIFHPSLGMRTVSYVTSGADTINSIASGIAAAITADAVLGSKGITASASGGVITVKFPALTAGDQRPAITTSTTFAPSHSLTAPTFAAS